MTLTTPHIPLLLAQGGSNAALITFLIYILGVFGLAVVSNRLLQKKSFLSEYFLGSRSLGVWAFALTFAATSASGGSFTGFPSKIYTHGWILGLWIGSYIVVPICAMGLLGKRINQVARKSGAITVPDVLRDRFHSAPFGLMAVSLIVFFMSFNLVAQFKSGSEILRTLLQDVESFKTTVAWVADVTAGMGPLADVDPAYLLCLLTFALAVIIYTTYGGFHAVVWTDVMQGVVMVVGVIIMLPLAIWQVGGLARGTQDVARMTPPRLGLVNVDLEQPLEANLALPSPWFAVPGSGDLPRLFRVSRTLAIPAGQSTVEHVQVVELTTPGEIRRQLERLEEQEGLPPLAERLQQLSGDQVLWLHTAPELAAARVTITLNLPYRYGSGRRGVYVTGPGPNPPALPKNPGLVRVELDGPPGEIRVLDADGQPQLVRQADGPATLLAVNEGSYQIEVLKDGYAPARVQVSVVKGETAVVSPQLAPGESQPAAELNQQLASSYADGFLPLSLAISFFFMWAISGAGQPSSMVRLMAFKDSTTLRRSIFTVAMYYSMIYFPLVVIFCCARVILPGMDLESDRIMPQMAVTLTTAIGQGWLAGLLVAAPFAAVMSTVDSFLLMISSALVRDIYQRSMNPAVSERSVKRLSYLFTMLVGAAATLGAINPPQFLQDIIVYTGSGLAACFLGPMVFALYWPRANAAGCMAGMAAGFLAHLSMYVGGIFANGSFYRPLRLLDFNPIIIGLVASFATVLIVSRLTPAPSQALVRKYFYRQD